jgi:hypothetical protein
MSKIADIIKSEPYVAPSWDAVPMERDDFRARVDRNKVIVDQERERFEKGYITKEHYEGLRNEAFARCERLVREYIGD